MKHETGEPAMPVVRDAVPADAERLLEIYDYYVKNTAITFEYETPTPEEFRGRMCRTLARYPYLVAEEDGVILGSTYAGAFVGRAAYDWACETTFILPPMRAGAASAGCFTGRWSRRCGKWEFSTCMPASATPSRTMLT